MNDYFYYSPCLRVGNKAITWLVCCLVIWLFCCFVVLLFDIFLSGGFVILLLDDCVVRWSVWKAVPLYCFLFLFIDVCYSTVFTAYNRGLDR